MLDQKNSQAHTKNRFKYYFIIVIKYLSLPRCSYISIDNFIVTKSVWNLVIFLVLDQLLIMFTYLFIITNLEKKSLCSFFQIV